MNLADRPNPPALFALLRRFSLLASQRACTLASLREAHLDGIEVTISDGTRAPDAHTTSLTFQAASGTGPALRLDYVLPSLSPTAPPTPPTLSPLISEALAHSLSPESRRTLESIPARFGELLAEGYGVAEAATLVVRGCLGA